MLLAIDTATRWLGVALYDGTAVLGEIGWRSQNNQTVELAPVVADLLGRTKSDFADLDAIAVANGPGSYTGLRIGLAFAKGVALAGRLKLIGVPTLDIVTVGFGQLNRPLISVAEAGRTRILAATYTWQGRRGWQADEKPLLETWENVIAAAPETAVFAGEIAPSAATQLRTAGKGFRVASPALCTRRAAFLAELGWQRLRHNKTDDPAALVPNYLRAPDGA